MDPDNKRFGRGPRELTGAVDLISHFKLLPHQEFFCKRSLPLSISDTHYLHNVVGDTEIRKGEGMQLDQLIQDTSLSRETSSRIQPFDLDVLGEAFRLREAAPVDLPPSEKGIPTVAGKSKVSRKTRRRSIKSTKIRTKSIRSTNIVIKIEVKTRIKTKREIKVFIMILVLIFRRNITRRKGSMMERRNLMMFTNTREASTRAQRLMRLVQ
uniref:Putative ovule protein n=1 Tax=Solanum chacoense TaxID=4108 RepID=A0A0V0IDJ0_SOLCH